MSLNTLNLHLTNRCNLICKHCLYQSGEKHIPEMSLNELKSVVSEFAEISNNSGTINIYGGEPLLRDDFFEIADYIVSKKINIGITTNMNVSSEILKKIAEISFSRITIDFDGASNVTHDWLRNKNGHFENSINAIKYLKSKSQYISINTVLHNKNTHEIEDLLLLCSKLKIDLVNFYLFTPLGRGAKYQDLVISPLGWKTAYNRVKKWAKDNEPIYSILWERAYEYEDTLNSLHGDLCETKEFDVIDVRCDGNVYFCGLLTAVDAASMGNVLITPLKEIVENRIKHLLKHKTGCAALGYNKSRNLQNLADSRKSENGIVPVCPYDWQIITGNDRLKKKFAHINL